MSKSTWMISLTKWTTNAKGWKLTKVDSPILMDLTWWTITAVVKMLLKSQSNVSKIKSLGI